MKSPCLRKPTTTIDLHDILGHLTCSPFCFNFISVFLSNWATSPHVPPSLRHAGSPASCFLRRCAWRVFQASRAAETSRLVPLVTPPMNCMPVIKGSLGAHKDALLQVRAGWGPRVSPSGMPWHTHGNTRKAGTHSSFQGRELHKCREETDEILSLNIRIT